MNWCISSTLQRDMPMDGNDPGPRATSPPADPPRVLADLEATLREMRRVRLWLGLARLGLAEVALAAALMLADGAWVLPIAARMVGLLAMGTLAVAGVVRLVVRPRDRLERHDVAAE